MKTVKYSTTLPNPFDIRRDQRFILGFGVIYKIDGKWHCLAGTNAGVVNVIEDQGEVKPGQSKAELEASEENQLKMSLDGAAPLHGLIALYYQRFGNLN